MTEPREEESSWDSLADDLGLPPIEEKAPRTESNPKSIAHREESSESLPPKLSVFEVVVPPSRDTSVVVETPGHITVSVTVHADHTHESPVVEVVDTTVNREPSETAEIIDDEGDEEEESLEGTEAPRGKKRRRRRRRGRRGSENAETAEGGATEAAREASEMVSEMEEEAPLPPTDTEVEVEDAPEMNEETEEAEPRSAIDEEMEAEVSHAKQEWNVVSWVDLVATLHRPER